MRKNGGGSNTATGETKRLYGKEKFEQEMKNMGLFGQKEDYSEVCNRVRNSECGRLFSQMICFFLSEGDDHYQWLMANSGERMFKIEVAKQGVLMKWIEVSRRRLKETGTYDVNTEGWGFGASGYQDLPSSSYVSAFRSYLFESIENECPNIEIVDGDYIKLKSSAKKAW